MKTRRLIRGGRAQELLRRAAGGRDPVARRLAGGAAVRWRRVCEREHALAWAKKAWRRTAARNERGGPERAARREAEMRRKRGERS